MNIVEAETRQLLDELETVRKAKHDVEEARARGAKERDMKIEQLASENRVLMESLREMRAVLEKKEEELKEERSEMAKVEAGLFRAQSEVRVSLFCCSSTS